MTARHIEPSMEAGRALMMRGIKGPIVMLNLLRFRDVADYAAAPALAPPAPISGAEAFRRYIDHTRPHLQASGGELVFLGDGGPWFIGPANERWDMAMLVKQRSLETFMAWAANEAYLEGVGHRTAAIDDARLLPLVEI
jgi:hypothetical protein